MNIAELLNYGQLNSNNEKLSHNINESTLKWHYSPNCDRVWWAEDGNESHTKAIFCRDRIDVGGSAFIDADVKACPLAGKLFLVDPDKPDELEPCPLKKYCITIDAISINPYSPMNTDKVERECQRNGFIPDIKPIKRTRKLKSA